MNVHLKPHADADTLLGKKMLSKYNLLHEQGKFEKAEECLEKAVVICKYPPAIRQASWLALEGYGRQPPDRDRAVSGFRMAAQLGDPVSFFIYRAFTFSLSATCPYPVRLPASRSMAGSSLSFLQKVITFNLSATYPLRGRLPTGSRIMLAAT